MLSDFSATSADLTRSLFHTVSVIYTTYPYASLFPLTPSKTPLSDNQARALIMLVKRDLNLPERQSAAFALVRVILTRRVMISELYDLMDELSVTLLQSFSETTRNHCSRVLLFFLLNYPMSEGRIEKMVSFLLKNIEYEEPSGRLADLNLLHAVVKEFPLEVSAVMGCDE